MATLTSSIVHPTSISQQYRSSATIYYPAASRGSMFPRRRLPNNQERAQTIEKQTILVDGVYHRQYTTPPDTTTTNLPLKGSAIDV